MSHHLVEEASAEEEELTGHVGGASTHAQVTMERDEKLVKVRKWRDVSNAASVFWLMLKLL